MGVTTEGKNHMLDSTFHGSTQVTTWYLGLIDNSPTPTLAAADTMSSHSGWTENQDYTGGARGTWTEDAASSGSITNSSTVNFSMTPSSAEVIYGVFLTSDNTLGGTSGTLMATAAFTGGTQTVNNGDTLKLTFTFSLS